jgi:hypothetical protein
VNRRVLLLALLVACDTSPVPEVDLVAPVIAAAEASGGEATCGGGGAWRVCLVLTDGVLTVVPVDDNINNNQGVTMILELEGVSGSVEVDLESPPTEGILWAGGSLEAQFVDQSGANDVELGSLVGQFRGTGR